MEEEVEENVFVSFFSSEEAVGRLCLINFLTFPLLPFFLPVRLVGVKNGLSVLILRGFGVG